VPGRYRRPWRGGGGVIFIPEADSLGPGVRLAQPTD